MLVQATVLVHDAYLRLIDVEQVQLWNSRGHFFLAALSSDPVGPHWPN